jgi:hypothetical protein
VTGWVDLAGATSVLAVTYTGIAVVVHVLTRTAAAQADAVRVVVCPMLLAGVLGGLAMLRASGLSESLFSMLPWRARAMLAGVAAGVLCMVGIAAAVFVASMTVHFTEAMRVAEGLNAGLVGGLILALIGAGAVPNGVLCAGAYVAGPGFVLGTDSAVSPFDVHLGPLPAFPVLAAVPRSSGAWWQEGLLLLPLAAGVVAGLITLRRSPVTGVLERTGLAAGSGAAAGCVFGLSTWLATGALGPGRMQDIGPDVFLTTVVCTASLALGAAACALVIGLRPKEHADE